MKNKILYYQVIRAVSVYLLTLYAFFNLAAQHPYSLSIFNHATTLPPNGISGPLHPGIDIGISTRYREKTSSRSFLHWKLGYYYHRLVHHGIQLYGEYTKQYTLFSKLGLGWSAGLGYVHTIELHEKFKLDASGEYERTGRLGKPHAQLSVGAALHYPMGKVSPFIQYRVRMVTPFVNEYVPLLPSTSWHIGFYYGLQTTKNK
jgi:hypothetical protein